jgi:hypothetical protein
MVLAVHSVGVTGGPRARMRLKRVTLLCFTLFMERLIVEHKSRADFAPDFKLPLSKLTATDNIMLGNHDQ